jgi:hypothetical protein
MAADNYHLYKQARRGLLDFLCKLQIKSAFAASLSLALQAGSSLQVEDLGAVLTTVTFDDKDLKLWPLIKNK